LRREEKKAELSTPGGRLRTAESNLLQNRDDKEKDPHTMVPGLKDMSNSRFIAIVGAIIVASIVVLVAEKMNACNQFGGKACCFGRQLTCNLIVKQNSGQP
jgi:hypothetical protein